MFIKRFSHFNYPFFVRFSIRHPVKRNILIRIHRPLHLAVERVDVKQRFDRDREEMVDFICQLDVRHDRDDPDERINQLTMRRRKRLQTADDFDVCLRERQLFARFTDGGFKRRLPLVQPPACERDFSYCRRIV